MSTPWAGPACCHPANPSGADRASDGASAQTAGAGCGPARGESLIYDRTMERPDNMADIRVVVVGPKFPGNVGAICRCMANFDVDDLWLVNPCEIDDEARNRAKHGNFILERAHIVSSMGEAVEGCFLVAGTSGIVTKGESNYARIPVPAREFAEGARGYGERIALVFGREDVGLLQAELNQCDVLIHVPTSDEYPILNLSHSVGIVLYEMFEAEMKRIRVPPADGREKALMFEKFRDLLDGIGYPSERRESTSVMFRRMMGRAIPTKYEYHTIMGVFGDAVKLIRGGGWKGSKRHRHEDGGAEAPRRLALDDFGDYAGPVGNEAGDVLRLARVHPGVQADDGLPLRGVELEHRLRHGGLDGLRDAAAVAV